MASMWPGVRQNGMAVCGQEFGKDMASMWPGVWQNGMAVSGQEFGKGYMVVMAKNVTNGKARMWQ